MERHTTYTPNTLKLKQFSNKTKKADSDTPMFYLLEIEIKGTARAGRQGNNDHSSTSISHGTQDHLKQHTRQQKSIDQHQTSFSTWVKKQKKKEHLCLQWLEFRSDLIDLVFGDQSQFTDFEAMFRDVPCFVFDVPKRSETK